MEAETKPIFTNGRIGTRTLSKRTATIQSARAENVCVAPFARAAPIAPYLGISAKSSATFRAPEISPHRIIRSCRSQLESDDCTGSRNALGIPKHAAMTSAGTAAEYLEP